MDAWYLNPLRWVDADDLFDISGTVTVSRAIDVLKDKAIHRPADEAVMVRGLWSSVRANGLTRRQESALELARVAMQTGATATMYVAEHLGINRFSAWKLLKRCDARLSPKMETSGENFDIYHRRAVTEADIQHVLQALKVECAGCGNGGASARYALCRECFVKYGPDGERSDVTSKWLDPMIRLTRRDARKRAIEICMTSNANPMALVG